MAIMLTFQSVGVYGRKGHSKNKKSAAPLAEGVVLAVATAAVKLPKCAKLDDYVMARSFYHSQESAGMYVVKWRKLLADCRAKEVQHPEIWQEFSECRRKKKVPGEPRNYDLKQGKNFTVLVNLYKRNKLVTTRLGNVESSFLSYWGYGAPWHVQSEDSDLKMQTNAGLYYKNESDRRAVNAWWTGHTIDIIRSSQPTSCIAFLPMDLFAWSLIGLQHVRYYDWGLGADPESSLVKIVLKHSEQKKILYLGQATESVEAGYRNLKNVWPLVSNFTLYTMHVPQTTLGMPQPKLSIIEEAPRIVERVHELYSDFDTAVLGCGAWGPPLMNLLRRKYGASRNLMYLGSETYNLFGVRTKHIAIGKDAEANASMEIEARESVKSGTGLGGIDGGKYWSRN